MNIKQSFLMIMLLAYILGFREKLSAQSVPNYSINYGNPISMGMASLGVGSPHSSGSIYTNPGFLQMNEISVLDLGGQMAYQNGTSSSVQPGGAGTFYNVSEFWGFYASYSHMYSQYFTNEKQQHFTKGHIGLAFKLSDNWAMSFGLGPGAMQRKESFSTWSYSGNLSLAYLNDNWSFGISVDYPGKYRMEDYRENENLKETLPARTAVGVGYKLDSDILLHAEIRKIFWDRSERILNNEKVTPDWERGIGAEWGGSISLQKNKFLIQNLDIRSGIEMGGLYDRTGKNLRSLGIGVGSSYSWRWENSETSDVVSMHLGITDYNITSQKGGRPGETIFAFSLSYASIPIKEYGKKIPPDSEFELPESNNP
ncbi:hypothetical protein [Leptospira sp. GIMC2001]|uniref:hypothetical protein n=1 Tax=Leptospira sp. GIMC2001 TaxID=1513297 RepID=UPI002348FABA|nr:hypothetical protein [Leptospira sp. GIMC2001]WCL47974.1 hypothetical protein O4O04_11660 [Leptospira sp. GIMC2001]